MYETKGLFTYGRWVNGGHWTTCEGRMQLGYYRVGAFDDAKEGFKQILKLSPIFRLDNNLTNFGADLYQPNQPINCVYDCWGAPGGFLRGLFEYEYKADGMRIYPHIPEKITQLQQKFPVYFGKKQIYIAVNGTGSITSVLVNGKKMEDFDPKSVFLKMNAEPEIVRISIGLGNQPAKKSFTPKPDKYKIPDDDEFWKIDQLMEEGTLSPDEMIAEAELKKIWSFYTMLDKENLSNSYEYKHAGLPIVIQPGSGDVLLWCTPVAGVVATKPVVHEDVGIIICNGQNHISTFFVYIVPTAAIPPQNIYLAIVGEYFPYLRHDYIAEISIHVLCLLDRIPMSPRFKI